MAMTLEQQRALAMAQARLRLQQQGAARQEEQTIQVGGQSIPRSQYMAMPDEERQALRSQIAEANPGVSPYQSPVPGGGSMNAFAEGFGGNVPILGPLTERAADFVGSHIASAITGRPRETELAMGQQRADMASAEHPVATTAGDITGAVGPLLGVGQAFPRLLGLEGPMVQRALTGLLSGTGLAGADAAARGEDLGQVGQTAATGGVIGALVPFAERALSPVARLLTGNSVPRSVQSVNRNLEREGIDPQSISALLAQNGPDAVLADIGPNLTRQAGAIASLPGEGQTVLRDALVRRQQGTNARIQGETENILGPATTPRRFETDIRAQQTALSPQYEAAFANATRVDTAPVALNLDSAAVNMRGEAQSVAERLRSMLDVVGTDELDPNPRTLFEVRKAIDGMFDTVQDGNARRLLSETRREVDGLLANAVPGIKQVDAEFAQLAQQRQAFEDGMAALDSGRTSLRPTDLQDILQGAPDNILDAFSQGTRSEIDRLIGTTTNDLNALRNAVKGDGSWNRERLAEIFGPDRSQQLIDLFERELTYNRTYNTVLQNSETAARTAAQKEAAPHQFGSGTSVIDLLLKVPQQAANAAARSRSEGLNREIAELLIGRPSPQIVDQMIAARHLDRGLVGSAAVPALTSR